METGDKEIRQLLWSTLLLASLLLYHFYFTSFFVVMETGDKEIRQLLWSTLLLASLLLYHFTPLLPHSPTLLLLL